VWAQQPGIQQPLQQPVQPMQQFTSQLPAVQQSYPQQGYAQSTNFQAPNQVGNGQCFKCGAARHHNINECPAVNTCFFCGRMGHFVACVAQRQGQLTLTNHNDGLCLLDELEGA